MLPFSSISKLWANIMMTAWSRARGDGRLNNSMLRVNDSPAVSLNIFACRRSRTSTVSNIDQRQSRASPLTDRSSQSGRSAPDHIGWSLTQVATVNCCATFGDWSRCGQRTNGSPKGSGPVPHPYIARNASRTAAGRRDTFTVGRPGGETRQSDEVPVTPVASIRSLAFQRKQVEMMVLVKATPQPSTKYGDTVCVAGALLHQRPVRWIRLYPIPFRYLESAAKFRKYQTVKVAG